MDRIDILVEQWRKERPDLDASPMEIVGRIMHLDYFVESRFEEIIKSQDITLPEFDVLAVMRRCGKPFKMSVGSLCSYSLLSSGAMTNRIDRLERKGLVVRERNPADRRGVLVVLTNKGFELIQSLIELRLAEANRITSLLSTEDQNNLAAILRRLVTSMQYLDGYADETLDELVMQQHTEV